MFPHVDFFRFFFWGTRLYIDTSHAKRNSVAIFSRSSHKCPRLLTFSNFKIQNLCRQTVSNSPIGSLWVSQLVRQSQNRRGALSFRGGGGGGGGGGGPLAPPLATALTAMAWTRSHYNGPGCVPMPFFHCSYISLVHDAAQSRKSSALAGTRNKSIVPSRTMHTDRI